MKSRFWKKTAAGLLALLIVTGNTPAASFIRLTERPAVTARAADELPGGQCGEFAYWVFDPDQNIVSTISSRANNTPRC